jgi:hypothetical protein
MIKVYADEQRHPVIVYSRAAQVSAQPRSMSMNRRPKPGTCSDRWRGSRSAMWPSGGGSDHVR